MGKYGFVRFPCCTVLVTLLLPLYLAGQSYPQTFVTDNAKLIKNKGMYENGDSGIRQAVYYLLNDANQILKEPNFSITNKSALPQGGTIHDYYSISGYRWPDSSKSPGSPFIKMDGKINPGRDKLPDPKTMGNMSSSVFRLALAYYYTENEQYAKKAAELLEVFFLNGSTRMNPNFEFSQMIPGRPNSGGATISAIPLISVVEAAQLLTRSQYWTDSDQKHLQEWFTEFLNWMLNSSKGKEEALAKNNIGNYYILQAAVYALYIDNYNLADSIVKNKVFGLIGGQINAKGEMPYELKRVKPWDYVSFNITALDELTEVGRRLNLNLLDYVAPNGGNIKRAFDWLIPFAEGKKKWRYGHDKVSSNRVMQVLHRIRSVDYSYITKDARFPVDYNVILY